MGGGTHSSIDILPIDASPMVAACTGPIYRVSRRHARVTTSAGCHVWAPQASSTHVAENGVVVFWGKENLKITPLCRNRVNHFGVNVVRCLGEAEIIAAVARMETQTLDSFSVYYRLTMKIKGLR